MKRSRPPPALWPLLLLAVSCTPLRPARGAEDEPFLFGYRALQGTVGAIETHAAPRGPEPEWKTALINAKAATGRGDYYQAIKTLEGVLGNSWSYSRMAPSVRYEAHLTLGNVLLRAGMYTRAELALYEATSLHSEPHEAYKALALAAAFQGDWNAAQSHLKNCLFLDPSNTEYLQRLGGLLLLDGSVNEGRHYLRRAVDLWAASRSSSDETDTSGNPVSPIETPHANQALFSWMIEYLHGAVAMNWPPHGRFDGDSQSGDELSMLSQVLQDPGLLPGQAFFDLGVALWESGAWTAAARHMERGKAIVARQGPTKTLSASVTIMSLRLVLNFPWVWDSLDEQRGLVASLKASLDDHLVRGAAALGVEVDPLPNLGSEASTPAPVDEEEEEDMWEFWEEDYGYGYDEDVAEQEEEEADGEYFASEGDVLVPGDAGDGVETLNSPSPEGEFTPAVHHVDLSSTDVFRLYQTIPILAWQGYEAAELLHKAARVLRRYSSSLVPTPLTTPPRDLIVRRRKARGPPQDGGLATSSRGSSDSSSKDTLVRVGILSASLCEHPAGKLFLALSRALHRQSRDFRLTLFAFPTAVDSWSWNMTEFAHNYVKLPAGDWQAARRRLLAERMDALIWADWHDESSYFVGFHRLAPLQVVLATRGTPSGLPEADYILTPEYLSLGSPNRDFFGEQQVEMQGFGMAWGDIEAGLGLQGVSVTAPLRYEYHGQYFFQSQNIFLVLAPVQQISHDFDQVLKGILLEDEQAVIVLVADPTELPRDRSTVAPRHWQQRLLRRLRRHLPRKEAERVRLIPPISHGTQLELIRVVDAVLDPFPAGSYTSGLEALALGTPVITRTASGSRANFLAAFYEQLGLGQACAVASNSDPQNTTAASCCVASSVQEYIAAAVRLGEDSKFKLNTQRSIRRSLGEWNATHPAAQSDSIVDFIRKSVRRSRANQRRGVFP